MSAQHIELMIACENLEKMDMGIPASSIWECDDPYNENLLGVHEIVRKFGLERMLGCKKLEEVYIDGIYEKGVNANAWDLDELEGVGKWSVSVDKRFGLRL